MRSDFAMDINTTSKECTLWLDGLIKTTFSDVFVILTVFQFLGAFSSLSIKTNRKPNKNPNTQTHKKGSSEFAT